MRKTTFLRLIIWSIRKILIWRRTSGTKRIVRGPANVGEPKTVAEFIDQEDNSWMNRWCGGRLILRRVKFWPVLLRRRPWMTSQCGRVQYTREEDVKPAQDQVPSSFQVPGKLWRWIRRPSQNQELLVEVMPDRPCNRRKLISGADLYLIPCARFVKFIIRRLIQC